MNTVKTYTAAAHAFAALVHAIPETSWEEPGLGDWDLRALVGHTSRSLITVSAYLQHPADRQDVMSPADYYVQIRSYASTAGAAAIIERGRQAGRDLGERPASTVDALVDSVLKDLAGVDDPLIEVIGGLGIRLSDYLPTRVFELAVHGLDIARAADVEFALPAPVLEEATELAARIAVASGQGEAVTSALTGRAALPTPFSVV
ncbi:maleylpyruvate isomerase family mycothiol-dependent enzyme [Mycolicibacterium hodleri]|uniref:Maleylpyruvate isomerase family mycothiol-dependent enzyme n=1 Tax=Mycolicibacterium hodleri TaxID=49897 RepID=A0A502EGK6_9MYCO|nr:maleylpyruvate isomerase N-terminal domain-containing protein [Mycolicibacterium hodleri]TPG35616.1 maleylpyruvate isomerase family mycothiol-dependent enzyme [Mycolicibacterium hodleri]